MDVGAHVGRWVVALSRSTGAKYFFEPRSKESLWHDANLPHGWGWGKSGGESSPRFYVNLLTDERCATRPTADAVSAEPHTAAAPAVAAAPAPARARTLPYDAYALSNAAVLAAGADVVRLRTSVEAVCLALSSGGGAGGAGGAPPGTSPGMHRFPPLDSSLRPIIHDLAEEFELRAESVGEQPHRHVVIWHPSATAPPEVLEAEAEEEALRREAALLAERDAAAARAAAQSAHAEAPHAGRKGGGKKAGGRAAVATANGEEAVLVVPLFRKAEKRSYAQIEEDMRARKRQGGGAGGGGAAS